MRSMPQALLWETLSNGRWTIPGVFMIAILLPLLVYGALSGIAINPESHEYIVLQFAFVEVVIFLLAVGVAMVQGPHSRLYLLPISTNSIVAWHMFSGALILAAETAFAALLFNAIFAVDWPILGPALYAAAVWSAVQVLMSATRQLSLPMFSVAMAPVVLLCLWLHTRYGSWFSPPNHNWRELLPSEVVTLFVAFVVCYVMTNYLVAFARCGERLPSLGILSWIDRQWDKLFHSRDVPRFRSAADAQLWCEWNSKGFVLPAIVLPFWLLMVAWGFCAWWLDIANLGTLYEVVLTLGGAASILGLGMGLTLGLDSDSKSVTQDANQLGDAVNGTDLDSRIGSFLASRPVTNSELAKAVLRTAVKSLAIAWAAWVAVLVACLLLMWQYNELPTDFTPKTLGLLGIPLTLLGPWISMTNLAAIGMSGRLQKILFPLICILVGYGILMGVINHFYSDALVNKVNNLCTTIAAVLIVVGTFAAYVQAKRQHHLSIRPLVIAAIVACVLVVASMLLLPAKSYFVAYPLIFASAALTVLPIASMPLAIAWNRHR